MSAHAVGIETVSHEEFVGLHSVTGSGYPSPRYAHIYYAIRRLLHKDEVLKLALNGVKPQTASKKAHVFAKPFGLRVHCKTASGYLYVRRRRES